MKGMNPIRILFKSYSNPIQILFKVSYSNPIQILFKFYSKFLIQILFKYYLKFLIQILFKSYSSFSTCFGDDDGSFENQCKFLEEQLRQLDELLIIDREQERPTNQQEVSLTAVDENIKKCQGTCSFACVRLKPRKGNKSDHVNRNVCPSDTKMYKKIFVTLQKRDFTLNKQKISILYVMENLEW